MFFDALDFMRRTRPLDTLPTEDIMSLALNAELRDYGAGTCPIAPGDPSSYAQLIWEGEVQTADGEKRQLLGHSAWLDELAVLTGEPHRLSAVALRPTRLLCVSRADLGGMLQKHAHLRDFFVDLLTQRRGPDSTASHLLNNELVLGGHA
jgi:CRP-like cAMP-binding protein